MLAYNHGAENSARLEKSVCCTAVAMIGISVFFLLAFQLTTRPMASLFIRDAKTVAYAAAFIRIHCVSVPFAAIGLLLTVFPGCQKDAAGDGSLRHPQGDLRYPSDVCVERPHFPVWSPDVSGNYGGRGRAVRSGDVSPHTKGVTTAAQSFSRRWQMRNKYFLSRRNSGSYIRSCKQTKLMLR